MANTGAPISAVITPIGNSCGAIIVLETKSANTKKLAPFKKDKGNSQR